MDNHSRLKIENKLKNNLYINIIVDIIMAFIHTCLSTYIRLFASQMNNDLYNHLKRNLIEKIEGKCFEDYGYVSKIYGIVEKSGGIIRAEDTSASAEFHVKFSCKMSIPIKGKQIICEIGRMNKELLGATNGPFKIFIPIDNDRINKAIFKIDHNGNIKYMLNGEEKKLSSKDFVKVTLMSYTFNAGDDFIATICSLDNIASKEDIEEYYKILYDENPSDLVDIKEFTDGIRGEEISYKKSLGDDY